MKEMKHFFDKNADTYDTRRLDPFDYFYIDFIKIIMTTICHLLILEVVLVILPAW